MNSLCLECLLLSVSTASAELHEDLRTAVAAVNTVSLSVKAFVGATKRTLVVYKFRHSQTDLPIGFEPVHSQRYWIGEAMLRSIRVINLHSLAFDVCHL